MDYAALAQAATSFSSLSTLALLSFTESSCFIIPPEVLLIPAAIAAPNSAIFLGIFTSITSIFGAQFGYWIGSKGGKPLLNKFFRPEKVENVKAMYHKYDAWAILVAAFTPIPFKLATISAGVFEIDYRRFLVASAIGRSSRYMLISILLYIFGEPIKVFIEHDLNLFLGVSTIVVIFGYIGLRYGKPAIIKFFAQETIKERLVRLFTRYR